MFTPRFLIAAMLFICVSFAALAAPPETTAEMPELFQEDFEQGSSRWEMTDPKVWRVIEDDMVTVLALIGASDYAPPVRSPLNIARIKDLDVGDFVADFRVKQTGREYGHRDLCFFFGYQDASHFYYVHLATKADEHANSIFLVNGAPRVSIAKERTGGTTWDAAYHQIRVKRDTASGKIEVYFDDMERPVMTAEDKTFTHGTIGVGSFDDTGNFDEVTVWGTVSPPAPAQGK